MKENSLKKGIVWNLGSYVVLGVCTILIYILISAKYGKAQLGAYNIVLSFYMICGHIGVFGLQSAALYFVQRQKENRKEMGAGFVSFLLVTLITGTFVGIFLNLTSDFIGTQIFASEYIAMGLKKIPEAVILFSVNKMISGYVNGLGKMKHYAMLQGTRYFLLVSLLGTVIILGDTFYSVFYAFFFSELGVMAVGSISLWNEFGLQKPKMKYILEGIRFGGKAMFGNVISDINTRVDVMMLGILCSDAVVGTYSFITILAEGLMAVLFVFRVNYNPKFADLLHKQNRLAVKDLCAQMKKEVRLLFVAGGILVWTAYAVFCVAFLDDSYRVSIWAAMVLIFGCCVMAPYFVEGNICTLSGRPLMDTMVVAITIVANIILNYMFILKWEIVGAALATAVSYLIYSILTNFFVKRSLVTNEKEMCSDNSGIK